MMAMRESIVLFNPRSVRRMGSFTLPMGLIMASIKVREAYEVILIDQAVEPKWRSRLTEALARRPLCMGISAMTGRQIQEGLVAAQVAHEMHCPVVWGGLHPSLMPEQTMAHPLVDYVVEGEGEETFAELIRALDAGGDVGSIRGLWSKQEGAVRYGGKRPFVDLVSLPDIPYDLVDLNKYLRPGPWGATLSIYSSRGCPQRCRFCYNRSVHQSHWRAFPVERVLADVRRIHEKHPNLKHLEFWDDSFFPDLRRAMAIAQGIRDHTPKLTWSVLGTHVRDIERMDDDYLRALKESGLTDLVLGVESGSQGVIDTVHKNFKLDQLIEANRRLAQCGIRPTYTFISGIPGETDDDIRATTRLLFQLKRENPAAVVGNIKPFVPYPGTELYRYAVEHGFKPPPCLEDWSRFVWGNYVHLDIPWVPKERRRRLNYLYFYTVALNPEYMFISSTTFSVLAHAILPLTRWRVRHLCFAFPLEARVMAWAERRLL